MEEYGLARLALTISGPTPVTVHERLWSAMSSHGCIRQNLLKEETVKNVQTKSCGASGPLPEKMSARSQQDRKTSRKCLGMFPDTFRTFFKNFLKLKKVGILGLSVPPHP